MKEIILTKGEKEALNVFYGLSEQEFLIICHLSQHGQKTVNELIDDEYLKLKKERAYKILSDMIEKGFVRSIEEGKTMEFLVCEPESMFSIIKKNKMDYLKENGKEIERKLCACLQSPVFERLGYDVVGTKKVRDLYYNQFFKAKNYIYNMGNETSILIPKYDYRFFILGKLKIKQGVDIKFMVPITNQNLKFAKKMVEVGFKVKHIDEKYCKTVRRCMTETKTTIYLLPPNGREGKNDQVFVSRNPEFIEQTKLFFKMLWDEKAKDINGIIQP